MIEAWFDGACEPTNPGGHTSCASLIKVDGQIVHQSGRYIGHGPAMSNNVAEYCGFIDAILQVKKLPGPAIIRGDSKLVINQLLGRWKAKAGLYLPHYKEAANLFAAERDRVSLIWIPRAENEECDVLTKTDPDGTWRADCASPLPQGPDGNIQLCTPTILPQCWLPSAAS